MRWVYDAEDGLIMQKMDQLWRSGIISEVDFLDIYQTPIFDVHLYHIPL